MAACASAPATTRTLPPAQSGPSAVLQWSFRRGDDVVICRLGLDREESAYELTMTVPWIVRPSTERFADAMGALQRQAAVERLLVDEGWSLESFLADNGG